MNLKLWDSPYNGGWIWFSRSNWRRLDVGWKNHKLWWVIFGFCGSITLQTWPWKRRAHNTHGDV